MERKKIEKLFALLLIGILIPVSLFPFPINADSYVSPSYVDNTQRDKWQNAGGNVVNFSEDPLTGSTPSKLTFTFNDNYYGFVSFQPYSGSSVWNDSTVFIAGGVGYYNYRNSSSYNPKYIDGVKITYVNLFLPDSNVDLSQIISILTAIENDTTSIDTTTDTILTDLQSVLNQIIVANGYLETLTKMKQWHFPIESYAFNYYLLKRYDPTSVVNFSYYDYPVFSLKNNDYLYSAYLSVDYKNLYLIFGIDKNIYLGALPQYFDYTGLSVNSFDSLYLSGIADYRIVKIVFTISDTSVNSFDIKVRQNINIVPILAIRDYEYRNNYFSTDFALQFGLSNRLLDDLDIIANGTSQSSSASGSLDQATSQFSDDASDLVTIEESFNSSMNQSLQSVNPTFNMGSSFLTSANWVSQQFNRIVNNTPFASLITFGLTLGLGLLIIGKVRK